MKRRRGRRESCTNKQKRGRIAESRAKNILIRLQEEGCIDHFKQTPRYSFDDRNGVDFFLYKRRDKIPLQIKSSKNGAFIHRERHPRIPVVIINGSKTNWQVMNEIIVAMKSYYRLSREAS